MGPYMKPIPIGASLAMIFSLLVAFMISPWALAARAAQDGAGRARGQGRPARPLYRKVMGGLLDDGKRRRWFFAGMAALMLAAVSLVVLRVVTVKMLPFDNKSEFQVLVDMPPGTPLEGTQAAADAITRALERSARSRTSSSTPGSAGR